MKKAFNIMFIVSLVISVFAGTLLIVSSNLYSLYGGYTLFIQGVSISPIITIIILALYLAFTIYLIIKVFKNPKYEITKTDITAFIVYFLTIILLLVYHLIINANTMTPMAQSNYLLCLALFADILLKIYILFITIKKNK